MGKYKIANVIIDFKYISDTFFKDSFKHYKVNDDIIADFKISSKCNDVILDNKEVDFLNNKNKKVYLDSDLEVMDIYNKNKTFITTRIKTSKDKKIVKIEFNRQVGENLAEYEYVLTGIYFLTMCLEKGLIPIHASAINYNNDAILFSAPSTTGKSTQARLWKKVFDEVEFINDDKPLIAFEDNEFYVYGSPWSGKDGINQNKKVKLKAIIFLNQSKDNFIRELSNKEKLELLFKNIHRPQETIVYDKLLKKLDGLIKNIDILNLNCNMDNDAVATLHKRLYKEK